MSRGPRLTGLPPLAFGAPASDEPAPLPLFLRNPALARQTGALPLEPPGGRRWGSGS